METLRQRRTPLRSTFTKAANLFDAEAGTTSPDLDKLAELLEQLQEKGKRLAQVQDQIDKLLLEQGCSQQDYEVEFEAAEAYRDRLSLCRSVFTKLRRDAAGTGPKNQGASENTSKRKYRLPELELKKFDGSFKDWLAFWGQFRKIHTDAEIDEEDKFQYLIQATAENSRARELVTSFPPTASSYKKAVECLKIRFGNEDTLVEVYIRELLRLVLDNAMHPKQKIVLSVLYDKLETQLRSLETLGVTTDKYAAMLYPLVESCLPADVLKVWERNRSLTAGAVAQSQEAVPNDTNRLTLLMRFLRTEVEGEERINMAKTGFGLKSDSRKQGSGKTNEHDQDVPSAAGLFGANQKAQDSTCIFCEKQHASQDCHRVNSMSLEEKRKKVAEKECCFVCFRRGHRARKCKSKVRCPICERRHYATMCPDKPSNKVPESSSTKNSPPTPNTPKDENALTNNTCSSDVLLQTLVVRLRGERSSKVVRALVDTGSQRSYVLRQTAVELACQKLGQCEIVHHLFGGVETSRQVHCRYKVHLANLDESYLCNFEVLDQQIICGGVPKIPPGPWTRELQSEGIVLTDDVPCSVRCSSGIQILIGADIAGKLLTGRVRPLRSGPVAVETWLGWTLMGKTSEGNAKSDSALLVTSLFVKDAVLSDLWQLDRLGITDPIEFKSKEEHDKQVKDNFLRDLCINEDGRYEVALPWLDGHPQLPTNKKLAEQRLQTTITKLKTERKLAAYQEILEEWLSEGVIEEVPLEEQDNFGHYLPHRAVFREDHQTTKIRPVFDSSALL